MTKHQDHEIAYFSWKKNDLVFFFLQLPILHSHWFNCEDWLMIPCLQIPEESTANPHNGSKWQNMQTHPNKKSQFWIRNSPIWSSIVWKQFFVSLNLLFHSWIWVRCVTLTRNLFEELKNKEIWINQYPNAIHGVFFGF